MSRYAPIAALIACLATAAPLFGAEATGERQGPLRLLDFEIEDAAVHRVVEGYTISRALEPTRFSGRREHEEFLLDHLPLAAALGRRLYPPLEPYGIVERAPGVYEVEDRGALRGTTRLIAKAPGRRVYLVEGEFRSLARLVRFTGTMVIALSYREGGDGEEEHLVNEPHLYVRIDNILVHGLLKLLSPLIHGIIDRRVAALAAAAEAVSGRITRDPAGVYWEMKRWPEVTDAQRAEFRQHFGLSED